MNQPRSPREELEVRVTALLMGELPPEEAQLLEAQIAADADLQKLHERLRHAVELLREASAMPEQAAPAVPVTLSEERRQRLLAHFKVVTPLPMAAKPRRDWKWMVPLGLAASLIALVGGAMWMKLNLLSSHSWSVAVQAPDFDSNGIADSAGARGGENDWFFRAPRPEAQRRWATPEISAPATGESAPATVPLSYGRQLARNGQMEERFGNVVTEGGQSAATADESKATIFAAAPLSAAVRAPVTGLNSEITAQPAIQTPETLASYAAVPPPPAPAPAPPPVALSTPAPLAAVQLLPIQVDRLAELPVSGARDGEAAGLKAGIGGGRGVAPAGPLPAPGQPAAPVQTFAKGYAGHFYSDLGEVDAKKRGLADMSDQINAFVTAPAAPAEPAPTVSSAAGGVQGVARLERRYAATPTDPGAVPESRSKVAPDRMSGAAQPVAPQKRETFAGLKFTSKTDDYPVKADMGLSAATGVVQLGGVVTDDKLGRPALTKGLEDEVERLSKSKPAETALGLTFVTPPAKPGAEPGKAVEFERFDDTKSMAAGDLPALVPATEAKPANRGREMSGFEKDVADKKSEVTATKKKAGKTIADTAGKAIAGRVDRDYVELHEPALRAKLQATDQQKLLRSIPITAENGKGDTVKDMSSVDTYLFAVPAEHGQGVFDSVDSVIPAGTTPEPAAKAAAAGISVETKSEGFVPRYKTNNTPKPALSVGQKEAKLALKQAVEEKPVEQMEQMVKELNVNSAALGGLAPANKPQSKKNADGTGAKYATMPVNWLYVLRDGTIGPEKLATESNPIVGRTAFWTDDETAKVNINTAAEGNYWDAETSKVKIDEVLRSNGAPTQTAQTLAKMLPSLPPEGQTEAVQHIAKLLPEQEYAKIVPPGLRAKVQAERSEDEALARKPAPPADEPQPEIATSTNAFSTFSLNVSDVAFKLAGVSLEQGKMPEPATVRSEEFINAFDYHDPEPAPGAPLAFATERARYPFAQNRDLLRFAVKTAAAGRQPGHPLNVVLLLDNSGSMERADRVNIVREALRVLAAQLQPQDQLSVVTFARTPRLWIDGVAGDKAGEAVARVAEITPQGGTNIDAALDLGYATAQRHFQAGSINRVVLLTDGAANLGDVNPEALKKKVEAHRKQGVALDCFGIGWEDYDDALLETLSRNGDGRYGFINTPEEAATEFAGQLAGALHVMASDVKVQIEFNPRRVTAYRQIGYAKHQLKKEQFRDNTVDAAEIGAAESGNALYVVEVNPRGEGDLATVRVRFKDPGTSDYKEHEWAVPFTPNAPPLEQASPTLRLAGTASAFAEWLAGSPYAAEVTTDRLLGLINGVPAACGADPRPQRLEWMIRQAKNISGR